MTKLVAVAMAVAVALAKTKLMERRSDTNMKTTVAAPWIVIHDGTHQQYPYSIRCDRCGTLQPAPQPCSLEYYCDMCELFIRYHQTCRK